MVASKHEEKKDEFAVLRSNGMILNVIAETLGISQRTAERWNKDPAIRARISELKKAHLDELVKLGSMDQKTRMEALTATIRQIDEAIIDKDISKMSTDELLTLKLRYLKALREEEGTAW